MKKQKICFWLRWPVILINLYCCLPLGLILMIVRISKNKKAKQNADNLTIPYDNASYSSIDVPEDLIEKGKEIESNLKKELYCNKRDLPIDIFQEIKWYLLALLGIIIAYVFMVCNCNDFGTGFIWTLFFIGVPYPVYWNIIKRTKEVKDANKSHANYLRKIYQDTFNAFVFSEYIERRLLGVGIVPNEDDMPNADDEERRRFYHYSYYYKVPLRYKYSGQETEYIEGFKGFSFNWSIWKFGPFFYNVTREENQKATITFYSRKKIESEVVILRKNSEYKLKETEIKSFKKYEMDNSRFNEKFDIYAQNSVELFKIFTPAYMEKILKIAEKRCVGYISIGGECVNVIFDSDFPILVNACTGYNVHQAVAYAENVFRYFMTFMEDISPIGI